MADVDPMEAIEKLLEQVELATKGLGNIEPGDVLNALGSVVISQTILLRNLIVDLQRRGVLD